MTDKPRKLIKNQINKVRRDGPADIVDEIKVEPRMTLHPKEKNRFQRMVDTRKEEKYLRDQEKLKKPYIGNKRNMENRWVAQQRLEIEEEVEEGLTLKPGEDDFPDEIPDEIEDEVEEELEYTPQI